MSNILSLAKVIDGLNELLEAGERLDVLPVPIAWDANHAAIDAAIDAECKRAGVRRDQVELTVLIRKATEDNRNDDYSDRIAA